MTAILPSRRWIVRVVTANEVIFAVTADTEVDRRQNAVIVVWRSSCDGDLPSPRFAVFPDGVPAPFQRRYLARSTVEVMAEYPIQTVIQCQEQKRSRHIDAPTPAGAFLSLGFLCGCLCTG